MRPILLLVLAACADDPIARETHRYLDPLNRVIANDGPPAFDLGDLSAAGPPASPGLAGGGIGSPVPGGPGSPDLQGGLGAPSGGGGGVSPGPSGLAPDATIVALACDLFDALFQRIARCTSDPTGFFGQADQLFHGQTCEAYVDGILRVDPEPITPQAIGIITCFTAMLRNTPCHYTTTPDMFLQQCAPIGGS